MSRLVELDATVNGQDARVVAVPTGCWSADVVTIFGACDCAAALDSAPESTRLYQLVTPRVRGILARRAAQAAEEARAAS